MFFYLQAKIVNEAKHFHNFGSIYDKVHKAKERVGIIRYYSYPLLSLLVYASYWFFSYLIPEFTLIYFVTLPVVFLLSCSGKDDTRGDEEKSVAEVHQESRRTIDPSAIALPAGMKIEAVAEGLSYPVDVTFDDEGNTYIAEAGGHTFKTNRLCCHP